MSFSRTINCDTLNAYTHLKIISVCCDILWYFKLRDHLLPKLSLPSPLTASSMIKSPGKFSLLKTMSSAISCNIEGKVLIIFSPTPQGDNIGWDKYSQFYQEEEKLPEENIWQITAVTAGHFIAWIEAKYEQSTHQEFRYLNFDLANCQTFSMDSARENCIDRLYTVGQHLKFSFRWRFPTSNKREYKLFCCFKLSTGHFLSSWWLRCRF